MTTTIEAPGINITDSAQDYLAELLEKQNVEGIAVRIFITQPGTPYAETCLAYCRPGEEEPTDVKLELEKIGVFLDKNSLAFLEEAVVDFNADRMGGQLTIKAPNAKMPKVNADSPLEDRINYTLYSEINPGLAAHGGEIKLVELTEDRVGYMLHKDWVCDLRKAPPISIWQAVWDGEAGMKMTAQWYKEQGWL